MRLLIVNGRLDTMTEKGVFTGDLLVEDGVLRGVGRFEAAAFPDAERLDVSGLYVTPGLIDAHSHIGISEEKSGKDGVDCNEATNPVTPDMRALDAINPMDSAFHNAVAAGVTSVMAGPGSSNVVGGQFAFIKCDGRDVDQMVVLAPAAMKVALGENPKACYGTNGSMPQTRMGIAALLRRQLFAARAYCAEKSAAEKEGEAFRIDPLLDGWAPVFAGEIPMKAHVHRADDILTLIRIANEFGLSATLDHCTDGHLIAEKIFESGFPAIVGPGLAARSKIEVAHLDFKTAGALARAGVKVALTMDHPVTLIQYLPVAAALAAKEGLGEEEALRAVTANAADICRVQDRVGRLKEGLDADVALFDRYPLDVRARAMATVIGGKIVYDRKRDEADAL